MALLFRLKVVFLLYQDDWLSVKKIAIFDYYVQLTMPSLPCQWVR